MRTPPILLFIQQDFQCFPFFLPSEKNLITSHFSLEVLLARNVTDLRGTLDSHYAADR